MRKFSREWWIYAILIVVAVAGWVQYYVHRAPVTPPTVGRTYVVGFLGYNYQFPPIFNTFRTAFDILAEENHVRVQYQDIEVPYSATNLDHAADTLIQEPVDLIVTGQMAVPPLQAKTQTIPVICTLAIDPVHDGLAASEGGSGNNVVFIERGSELVAGDRLSYFLRLMPNARTILVPQGPPDMLGADPQVMTTLEQAAASSGVTLIVRQLADREALNQLFGTLDPRTVDAVFRYPDSFTTENFDLLLSLTNQPSIHKPLIVLNRTELEEGGTLSYGADLEDFGDEAANLAAKLLFEGVNPARVPIQRAFQFRLGINEQIAHSFGLAIPQDLRNASDYMIGEETTSGPALP